MGTCFPRPKMIDRYFAAEARLELRPSPHWLQRAPHFASAGLRALRGVDAVAPWAPNPSNLRVMNFDFHIFSFGNWVARLKGWPAAAVIPCYSV